MKANRIHRVYLAAPAGLAPGSLVTRPIKVTALATSRPAGYSPAVRQGPGAVTVFLNWAASLDWANALGWLVGDDLVDLARLLLADWPATRPVKTLATPSTPAAITPPFFTR